MKAKIEIRSLTREEVDLIVKEVRKFPNPLTSRKTWLSLKHVYILKQSQDLIGVCGLVKLRDCLKIGPFVVFKKYQGQGYGKMIFNTILSEYPHSRLFVGSRSAAVARLALNNEFIEEKNFFNLTFDIQMYLVKILFGNINPASLVEVIRKKSTQEGPYRFFLKKE